MNVAPFSIRIEDATLADLKDRLARTRWPDEINDEGWAWGTRSDYLRRLVGYWVSGFDWRVQEAELNRLPQFRAEFDGLRIHFVHVRGVGPACFPLVLTHGWPGSFIEMRKIIPLLTDPAAHGGEAADAFDVVVPSLPGYGFSDRPRQAGMSPAAIADLWARLMRGLGYQRFGAQGGDWGGAVSTWLSIRHPDVVAGIHLNFVSGIFDHVDDGRDASEQAYLAGRGGWLDAEGGYNHLQGTKPQTLAYGLTDSPAGLAAWIVEKFRTWSDCGGDVESVFTADELLANISIYWLTETFSSSVRIYKEARRSPLRFAAGQRVRPPLAFARFPAEIPTPPRALLERVFDLRQWTEMPRGGHFAAMEQPALLADDIRRFFRPLRRGS